MFIICHQIWIDDPRIHIRIQNNPNRFTQPHAFIVLRPNPRRFSRLHSHLKSRHISLYSMPHCANIKWWTSVVLFRRGACTLSHIVRARTILWRQWWAQRAATTHKRRVCAHGRNIFGFRVSHRLCIYYIIFVSYVGSILCFVYSLWLRGEQLKKDVGMVMVLCASLFTVCVCVLCTLFR